MWEQLLHARISVIPVSFSEGQSQAWSIEEIKEDFLLKTMFKPMWFLSSSDSRAKQLFKSKWCILCPLQESTAAYRNGFGFETVDVAYNGIFHNGQCEYPWVFACIEILDKPWNSSAAKGSQRIISKFASGQSSFFILYSIIIFLSWPYLSDNMWLKKLSTNWQILVLQRTLKNNSVFRTKNMGVSSNSWQPPTFPFPLRRHGRQPLPAVRFGGDALWQCLCLPRPQWMKKGNNKQPQNMDKNFEFSIVAYLNKKNLQKQKLANKDPETYGFLSPGGKTKTQHLV